MGTDIPLMPLLCEVETLGTGDHPAVCQAVCRGQDSTWEGLSQLHTALSGWALTKQSSNV